MTMTCNNTPEQHTETDRLLRPHEAADLLGISLRMLWRLRATDKLPVVKIGRSTRFRLSDLQRLVAEGVQ